MNKVTKEKEKVIRGEGFVEKVPEIYIEFGGNQFHTDEIITKIYEEYVAEGNRFGAIKSLRVYINIDDRKAYYVVNDKPKDNRFVEF